MHSEKALFFRLGPNSPMLGTGTSTSTRSISMACLTGLLRILPDGAGWRDLPAHDSKILKIRGRCHSLLFMMYVYA
jgi:hypothetical protein